MRHIALILNRHGPAHDGLTFGQRAADWLAKWAGSWWFVLSFLGVLVAWIVVNGVGVALYLWGGPPFDPRPYILLNLILSCLAAFQAPIIMMSQNRQAARDRATMEHIRDVADGVAAVVAHIEHDEHGIKAQLADLQRAVANLVQAPQKVSRHGRG